MKKVNAWWNGLKEWQRVAIAVAAIPLVPVLIIPGTCYVIARLLADEIFGGGK